MIDVDMVIELTGLNDIIPDVYERFRPIVRDGVSFLLSRISPERFLGLVYALGEEDTAPGRLVRLAKELPTLHKLGQTIARNQNIDSKFRKNLTSLENSIMKIDTGIIDTIVKDALGNWMNTHGVQINYNVCYEASVAAVVDFTCKRPDGSDITEGVFKVIKPDIPKRLHQELEILDALAGFYDANRHNYDVDNFRFIETFSDIKTALLKEIDLRNEQRNLELARCLYHGIEDVRIPRLCSASTDAVTVMELIRGQKITDANLTPLQRKRCAKMLFVSLVCRPLFSDQQRSIFHADPHAGNIYYCDHTDQIALLDWSLAGGLDKKERAAILRLSLDIFTGDTDRIYKSTRSLSGDDITTERVIRDEIDRFVTEPSTGFIERSLVLLDRLAFKGVTFPGDLLLLRKAIFTLKGVLQELDPDFDMDVPLIEFINALVLSELPLRWFYLFLPLAEDKLVYNSLLSNSDLIKIAQEWIWSQGNLYVP
ncbi:ubiquinone biosynthesis protein [Candidatus Magnetobacterium bavaricum]|uniref:Ubiquinone biosynthesis protein n=1 Tax=Candidatus Magnetobacterium bavaricum TaxID=29290 RepID=A0A0F3GQW2_9BACT|nr:ubiquinone biosynthesis protein [Candidatus Magnetobacterium bavaricum]